jgi:hypothetical protein
MAEPDEEVWVPCDGKDEEAWVGLAARMAGPDVAAIGSLVL